MNFDFYQHNLHVYFDPIDQKAEARQKMPHEGHRGVEPKSARKRQKNKVSVRD